MTSGSGSYRDYCDTGDPWLGAIPAHWHLTRMKRVLAMAGRIGFRGYTTDDIVDECDGAVVLSPSNIVESRFSLEKTAYLSWAKYYESPEIMVKSNDILLVKTGSTFGKSALVPTIGQPMTINPQMVLLKDTRLDPRFIAYSLSANVLQAHIAVNNTGSGMPTMTQANIGNFPIATPPDSEDALIANFLDYETAKIDALIEKQQQLIALLTEKRQAVISHAVTEGLNPDAPMRDSGVEWLGNVPAHWGVARINKFANKITNG